MNRAQADVEIEESVKDRLMFPRGVLCLLKETELFGPIIEKAIEDIDYLIKKMERC